MCQEMCLLHEFRSCPQKYKPFTYISTISLNKFIQKISETNKKFRGGEGRRRGENDLSLLVSSWCIVWELGKRYITFITTSIYPLISWMKVHWVSAVSLKNFCATLPSSHIHTIISARRRQKNRRTQIWGQLGLYQVQGYLGLCSEPHHRQT